MQRKSTLSSQLSQDRRYGFSRQGERILHLLRCANGSWVPLPEILALGIARYGARILELRQAGFGIENRTECLDGVRRSWYRMLNCTDSKSSDTPNRKKVAVGWRERPRLTWLPLFDSVVRK